MNISVTPCLAGQRVKAFLSGNVAYSCMFIACLGIVLTVGDLQPYLRSKMYLVLEWD